jgi:hypothetical protein
VWRRKEHRPRDCRDVYPASGRRFAHCAQ